MTLKEFQERTGVKVHSMYFDIFINPEYNNSELDKDEFCREWKRKGGMKTAVEGLTKMLYQLQHSQAELNEKANKLYEDFARKNDECIKLKREIYSLEHKGADK